MPGLDFVTRFGMYRSWGFSASDATRGILLSGAVDWTVKFAMAVIAVVLLVLLGVPDLGFLAVLAMISAVPVTVVLGVLMTAVRSERFTRWPAQGIDRTGRGGCSA